MPGSFSRWTAAQAALATSDEAVIEITSKEDFWHAWDTIGRSFAGDADHVGEPFFVWMLSTVAGFGPGNAHHIPYITFSVSMDRLPFIRAGGGFFAMRDEQGNIAACVHAVKMKGGKKPKSSWSMLGMLRSGITLGAAKRIPEIVKSQVPDVKRLFKEINQAMQVRGKAIGDVPDRLHAKNGPKPYHYYVSVMAVEPTQQGKGYASKLMGAISRIADAEGVPLFLECGSEKNVAVYSRLGYEVVDQQTIMLAPDDTMQVYAMVRQAANGRV